MANSTRQRRHFVVQDWGLVPYQQAWLAQKSLVAERITNPDLLDTLILLEHPPVYTLGKAASTDFLKFDYSNDPIAQSDGKREIYRVERGGEVTYHCPGQLVGYPILNLRYYQQDLHWYLRQLEEVIIKTIAAYGLNANRISGLTGVWLEGKKVAAIGIKVRRWITMHGFALNVCPELQGFQEIVPCGISDKPVGSLSEFLPYLTIAEVRVELIRSFAEVFNVEMRNGLD
ncbi:MAG: lipoyl(octanoyl) transferase LipB [Xenococcus sp. MO_188.B8]|nr:lipoyl(octanoyl) transferase LipB [Xenococcus sp. MO_188.B8]